MNIAINKFVDEIDFTNPEVTCYSICLEKSYPNCYQQFSGDYPFHAADFRRMISNIVACLMKKQALVLEPYWSSYLKPPFYYLMDVENRFSEELLENYDCHISTIDPEQNERYYKLFRALFVFNEETGKYINDECTRIALRVAEFSSWRSRKRNRLSRFFLAFPNCLKWAK